MRRTADYIALAPVARLRRFVHGWVARLATPVPVAHIDETGRGRRAGGVWDGVAGNAGVRDGTLERQRTNTSTLSGLAKRIAEPPPGVTNRAAAARRGS